MDSMCKGLLATRLRQAPRCGAGAVDCEKIHFLLEASPGLYSTLIQSCVDEAPLSSYWPFKYEIYNLNVYITYK